MTLKELKYKLFEIGFFEEDLYGIINETGLMAALEYMNSFEDVEGQFLMFATMIGLRIEGFAPEEASKVVLELTVNAKEYLDNEEKIRDMKLRIRLGF
jgi:hypothetical protein